MTRIKICGITNKDDAQAAVAFGADAIGFVFAPSPRQVTPERAREIMSTLPEGFTTFGVFVDAPLWQMADLDWLTVAQLHGSEPVEVFAELPQPLKIKAFRLRDREDLALLAGYSGCADGFLLDAYVKGVSGGTGQRFNWDLAVEAKRYGKPILLAGGLDPQNAAEAVERVAPDWLDISSGVEIRPGQKDHRKIEEFINNVREADRRA